MNYLNLRFTANEETIQLPFNHEFLLVPAPDNLADLEQIIAVNESGLLFWKELTAGKTPNEICENWSVDTGIDLSDLQDIALHLIAILRPLILEVYE